MDVSRNIAGSKRLTTESGSTALAKYQQRAQPIQPVPRPQRPQQHQRRRSQHQVPPVPSPQPQIYTLPVFSDELGRIPLHTQPEYSLHEQRLSSRNTGAQYWYDGEGVGAMSASISPPLDTRPMVGSQHRYTSDMSTMSSFPVQSTPYDQMAMHYSDTSQFVHTPIGGSYPIQPHAGTSAQSHQHTMPSRFPSSSQPQSASPEDATYGMWSNAPSSFE
jgi:hypothetical protein